jgi:hypothetical protein
MTEEEKLQMGIFQRALEMIALTRIVEADNVNTVKLRAVVNTAKDALNWKKTEKIPLDKEL